MGYCNNYVDFQTLRQDQESYPEYCYLTLIQGEWWAEVQTKDGWVERKRFEEPEPAKSWLGHRRKELELKTELDVIGE